MHISLFMQFCILLIKKFSVQIVRIESSYSFQVQFWEDNDPSPNSCEAPFFNSIVTITDSCSRDDDECPATSGDGAYPPEAAQTEEYPTEPANGLEGTDFSQPSPVVVYTQEDMDSVSDYMIPNIMACLLCCWCVGCSAILKSRECQNAKRHYDVEEARRLSKNARTLFIGTIITGVLIGVIGGVAFELYRRGLLAWLASKRHQKWRIQDFPKKGTQPFREVRQPIILQMLCRKLHKNEKNLDGATSPCLLGSVTDQ